MKKILSASLALILAASLFACDDGGKADETTPPGTTVNTTAAPETTEAVTEPPETVVPEDERVWLAVAGSKYGYLNAAGEWLIEPKFDYAGVFAENGLAIVGMSTVLKGDLFRYIDRSGNFAFSKTFPAGDYGATDFDESGLAIAASADGLYGYIDSTGEFVIEPQFEEAYPFGGDDAALVSLDGKYGYVQKDGTIPTEISFDVAYPFNGSELALAGVKVGEETYDDGYGGVETYPVYEYGYVDKTGKFVIEPQFDDAYGFSENGLAAVMVDYLYGYINTAGEFVIEPQFDEAWDFGNDGYAIFGEYTMTGDGVVAAYGFIDGAGNKVIPAVYESVASFAGQDITAVVKDGLCGYIDRDGNTVAEPRFDYALAFSDNGLAPVSLEGKYGYVNTSGEMVIEPQFDVAFCFDEYGYAIVGMKDEAAESDSGEIVFKYGIINEQGEVVVPVEYEYLY